MTGTILEFVFSISLFPRFHRICDLGSHWLVQFWFILFEFDIARHPRFFRKAYQALLLHH